MAFRAMRAVISILAGAGAFATFAAKAAEPAPAPTEGATIQAAPDEQAFLRKLHDGNKMEIMCAQMEIKGGSAPDVNAYAKMLVKDHKSADKLVKKRADSGKIALEPKELKSASKAEMDKRMDAMKGLKGTQYDR